MQPTSFQTANSFCNLMIVQTCFRTEENVRFQNGKLKTFAIFCCITSEKEKEKTLCKLIKNYGEEMLELVC